MFVSVSITDRSLESGERERERDLRNVTVDTLIVRGRHLLRSVRSESLAQMLAEPQ